MRISVSILCLALALSLAGCRGAINREVGHDSLTGDGAPPDGAQSAPAPQVSRDFQGEVARLRAEGLALTEAAEASLDGRMRHLAAIFKRAKPEASDATQSYELRILESDERSARTIFRRAEFFFSFETPFAASASKGSKTGLNLTDINGDGMKEVIVQSSSGGNCWSCNPTEIYSILNNKVELIAASPMQNIADLDGDGSMELVTTDPRWELYGDLSHAASPFASVIFRWKNGRYVYASRDFPGFYKEELSRLRASVESAKAEITAEEFSDEGYVGLSISVALAYAHMGEAERGLVEMAALLGSNVKSRAQLKRRTEILNDFRSGDSSKRLRGMKYGDPMPLG